MRIQLILYIESIENKKELKDYLVIKTKSGDTHMINLKDIQFSKMWV